MLVGFATLTFLNKKYDHRGEGYNNAVV